jgi:hypothetical protein
MSTVSIPSMSAPGVMLEVADAREAAAGEAEHIALHNEVFGADDPDFPRRTALRPGRWRAGCAGYRR